jgi:hypothetical protein
MSRFNGDRNYNHLCYALTRCSRNFAINFAIRSYLVRVRVMVMAMAMVMVMVMVRIW